MCKSVLLLALMFSSANALALTAEELSQYDCDGIDPGAASHYSLQTATPSKKSEPVIVIKKELKDGSFEVRNHVNREKGILLVQSEAGGVLKIMIVPSGYDIGPEYKCKKTIAGTAKNFKVEPAVK